jgi:signal transduction histidine kinase
MFAYGLKTNIAVQIALILFFGMGLTVFMTTNVVEHLLIQNHVARGRMLLRMLDHGPDAPGRFLTPGMMDQAGVSGVLIVHGNSDRNEPWGTGIEALEPHARKALTTGRAVETSAGKGWGVFWLQTQSVILAAPLAFDRASAAALAIPLSPLYSQIRRAQSLMFIYVLINGAVLTFLSVYQLSKLVVRPVQRLLRRAEDYHGNDKDLIFDEKGGNEFNTLSKALNNMLGRIADGRETLEKTVWSLERTNRELQQAQKDIIRAEKLASVGRLSSGIAHEIGNPLGIVSGYLELIKNPAIDTDRKNDFIVRAEHELARIDRIIRQLLNYSRTSPPTRQFFSAHDILGEVAEMLKVQPVLAGIGIDLNLGARKDRIMGDMDLFRQVLMNLILNAVDAIGLCPDQRQGLITIETGNPAEETTADGEPASLCVCVQDNGSGIPRKNLDVIFDPFFTTKDPGKGTGLGLSVCFTIIQDMGGRIRVDSTEGTGTRVTLIFPLPGSGRDLSSDQSPGEGEAR